MTTTAARKYPRARVAISTSCSYSAKGTAATRVPATVVWVGEGGVMLRTGHTIPGDARVRLSFTLPGAGVNVDSAASIRWWRKTADGDREVGLQFESPHAAVGSYVARRLALRHALEKAF